MVGIGVRLGFTGNLLAAVTDFLFRTTLRRGEQNKTSGSKKRVRKPLCGCAASSQTNVFALSATRERVRGRDHSLPSEPLPPLLSLS